MRSPKLSSKTIHATPCRKVQLGVKCSDVSIIHAVACDLASDDKSAEVLDIDGATKRLSVIAMSNFTIDLQKQQLKDLGSIELTILMPCLNEAETIESCVTKAYRFLRSNGVLGAYT